MSRAFNGAGAEKGAGAVAAFISAVARCVRNLWAAYWDYQARRAAALILASIDDCALKEIGLSRAQIGPAEFAQGEGCARPYEPFWRKP